MSDFFKETYTDIFEHSFDDKGRLTVPSEWRSERHEKRLHVMKSTDGCLRMYPASFLAEKIQKLSDLPFDDVRRKKLEGFVQTVQTVECDGQGRVMIKGRLRQSVGLEKSVVLLGCANHFEIWDRKKWEARSEGVSSFEDVAREVGL